MSTPEQSRMHSEAVRVQATIEVDLLKLPNVTGVFTGTKVTEGVDTGRVAIVVTVSEKKDVPKKDTIPAEIDGIPTDVIEEVMVPMQFSNLVLLDEIAPAIDATEYATLEGGMSIGPCRSIYMEPPDVPQAGYYITVGTLGCIVRDNQSNNHMMLSNFHVMCVNDGWTVGDTMAQPSRVDGGACPADTVGTLTRAQLDTNVDAAVSQITNRPHLCEILEIGGVNGTAVATGNMPVRKRGRTTELTHGTVTSTNYTTNVDYGDGLGVVTFTNQIRIVNDPAQSAFFGKKGDSGSVVVDANNNVVGLYFAGNQPAGTVGVANPIAAVLSALNVSMCTGGIKKLEKEFGKDFFNEKDWFKREKFETKEFELKQRVKDFVKDWKEYAYEKFDAYEGFDPWERYRGIIDPPRQPGLRPGVPEFGFPGGASGAAAAPAMDIHADRGCIDFRQFAPGPLPNPLTAGQFSIIVYDHTGAQLPSAVVDNWASHTGLNAGWTLEAKIDGRCPVIQATLVHFVQGATLEAYNADGSLAGTATMTTTQNLAQTLTIEGTSIAFIRILSPQNETLLLRLCCCPELICQTKAKETKEQKEWKEGKEKEWKEGKEKDLKEFKEPKEIKEPKEFKEIREGGIGQHFIPPSMRPDLSLGALSHEPDQRGRTPAKLQRQR